jgi:ribosomal-protein-alanine N-acetyltransferase
MSPEHFHPFPIRNTSRLVLRQLEETDAPAIFEHRADAVVNTWVDGFRHATVEDSYAFIERIHRETAEGRTIMWVLSEKGNNTFLGTVCLWNMDYTAKRAETGYSLVSTHHRKGLMHEALAAAIAFGFEVLQLETIDGYTHQHNEASIKLMLKNGFVQQAVPRKAVAPDRIYFSLTREKFASLQL